MKTRRENDMKIHMKKLLLPKFYRIYKKFGKHSKFYRISIIYILHITHFLWRVETRRVHCSGVKIDKNGKFRKKYIKNVDFDG